MEAFIVCLECSGHFIDIMHLILTTQLQSGYDYFLRSSSLLSMDLVPESLLPGVLHAGCHLATVSKASPRFPVLLLILDTKDGPQAGSLSPSRSQKC